MGNFLKRNAVFFFFPLVVVAIVFLARVNFYEAMKFGKWGEQSIVESTLVLAKDKIERVEATISATDHAFFQAIDPLHINSACDRWRHRIRLSQLIEAAAIIDENGAVIEYFHRGEPGAKTAKLYQSFTEDLVPILDMYDSLHQHKHIHRKMGDSYKLVTTLTDEFEGRYYTACLIYDTSVILGSFFEKQLGDVGKDRKLNVIDHAGHVMFGSHLSSAGAFIVVERFPSTLYKWRIQIATGSKALLTGGQRAAKVSHWLMMALAFGVILFGIIVLYMAMMRERRLNLLKSDFIANASHELKTPLALIRMFSELLTMGRVKDEKKIHNYHNIILRETERLTALIDNVLDFAKIERGKSAYEFKQTSLADLAEGAVEIYKHRIDEIGAKFAYNVEKDLPLIHCDPDAITLSLINLIDNAVKYAKGTNVIGVDIFKKSNFVFLEVYDQGSGIPPNHIKRVFERFYRYQASNLETRGQRGSGIGLSLVRHIALAHGGNVTVSSTPGVETRFSIRLPA